MLISYQTQLTPSCLNKNYFYFANLLHDNVVKLQRKCEVFVNKIMIIIYHNNIYK